MKSLYYYNPNSAMRLGTSPDIIKWKKLYNWLSPGVALIDRVGNYTDPVNTASCISCAIPAFRATTMSYRDCCNNRAKQLMDLSIKLQKPLGIMWSGGIDSTRVLVAFLENYPLSVLKTHIRVIMSHESVIENPEFYKKYILPNFDLINSEYVPWLFDKSIIMVTGELNDQLMGSDTMKSYRISNSAEFANKFNKDHIMGYVSTMIKDPAVTAIVVNAVIDSAEKYGRPLELNCDWFWWWNFCFKWQCVWIRLLVLSMPKYWANINENFVTTYLHSFFSTDEFQLWSVANPLYRDMKSWSDYKKSTKQDIFNFDHNRDYLDNKIKKGSLYTIFSQRSIADAIDSDFNIISTIDMNHWYRLNNQFS